MVPIYPLACCLQHRLREFWAASVFRALQAWPCVVDSLRLHTSWFGFLELYDLYTLPGCLVVWSYMICTYTSAHAHICAWLVNYLQLFTYVHPTPVPRSGTPSVSSKASHVSAVDLKAAPDGSHLDPCDVPLEGDAMYLIGAERGRPWSEYQVLHGEGRTSSATPRKSHPADSGSRGQLQEAGRSKHYQTKPHHDKPKYKKQPPYAPGCLWCK